MQGKVNCKHEEFNSKTIGVYVCKACLRTLDEIKLLESLQSAQSKSNAWERIYGYISKLDLFKEVEQEFLKDNCQSSAVMVVETIETVERMEAALKEAQADLKEKHNRMRLFQTVLLAYEQWEADIITENKCWGTDGMNSTPRLTIDLHERMLKLQEMRNSALYQKSITSRKLNRKMDWGKANCAVMGAIGTIEDNDKYKQESVDGLYNVFYYIDGLNRSRNYYKERERYLEKRIDSDDKRLMEACKKVDIGFMGCDTPDWLADIILDLQAKEQCLRDALRPFAGIGEKYKDYIVTNPNRPDTVTFTTERSNYVRAYEALGQEVKS